MQTLRAVAYPVFHINVKSIFTMLGNHLISKSEGLRGDDYWV